MPAGALQYLTAASDGVGLPGVSSLYQTLQRCCLAWPGCPRLVLHLRIAGWSAWAATADLQCLAASQRCWLCCVQDWTDLQRQQSLWTAFPQIVYKWQYVAPIYAGRGRLCRCGHAVW